MAADDGKYVSIDWPGWRGSTRDGVTREKGWTTTWPADGPRKLWEVDLGKGYSSFAVVGDRAYTMAVDKENRDNDKVYCLNARTGEILWAQTYACKSIITRGGQYNFTRCTPCVCEGIVHTLSREGHILALDADNGKVIWKRHAIEDFKATTTQYGFCGSPMTLDKWVIFDIGPIVALDRKTGEVAWKSKDYKCGHSSPVAFKWKDKTYVATHSIPGLVVVDAADGSEVGFEPHCRHINTCTVMPLEDKIFIVSATRTAFTAYGCSLLQLDSQARSTRTVTVRVQDLPQPPATKPAKDEVEVEEKGHGLKRIYENRNMANFLQNSVVYDGYAYGAHGGLRCVEVKTGQVKWHQDKIGDDFPLIVADVKTILITGKKSECLVIAKASSDGYKELARTTIEGLPKPENDPVSRELVRAACPVLSGGRLFLRWCGGKAMCFDVRPEAGAEASRPKSQPASAPTSSVRPFDAKEAAKRMAAFREKCSEPSARVLRPLSGGSS
jgi:hypothetical protein